MEIIVKKDIEHFYENLTLEVLKGVKNSSIKSVVVTFEPYLGTKLNIKLDEHVKGRVIFIWQIMDILCLPDPNHLKSFQVKIHSLLNSLEPDYWTVNDVPNQNKIEMAYCKATVDIFNIKEVSWDDLNSYNTTNNPVEVLSEYFKAPTNLKDNYSEADWQFLWLVRTNLLSLEESYLINESDKCKLTCTVDANFNFTIQLEFPSELDLDVDKLITALKSRFVFNR